MTDTLYTIGTILPMFKMVTSDTKALIFSNPIISRQDKKLACTDSPCPTSSYDSICSFKKEKEFISFLDRACIGPDPMHECSCSSTVLSGTLSNIYSLSIKDTSTYGICVTAESIKFMDFTYKDGTIKDGIHVNNLPACNTTYLKRDECKKSDNLTNPFIGSICSLWFCPVFDNKNNISSLSDINIVYNWLNDIVNIGQLTLPPGEGHKFPVNIRNYIRDSTLIYSIQNQFYNQIYQQGPYTETTQNDFIRIDPIKDYLDYKDKILRYYSKFNFFYKDSKVSDYPISLRYLMYGNYMLVFPKTRYIVSNGNYTYFLDIKITYSQYRDNILNTNDYGIQNTYLNGLLQNFFQDTSITVKKNNFVLSVNNLIVQYIRHTEDDKIFTTYDIGFKTLDLSQLPEPSSEDPTYPYKLLNIKITVKIIQWSNMLLAYFLNSYNNDVNVTADICNNVNLQNCNSVPISYLVYKPGEYKQTIENYCGVSFKSDNNLTKSLKLILISDTSDNCSCYNSTIAPPLDNNGGNKDAMCFNRYCNDDMRGEFNLDPSNCKSSCDQVYYWMTNNNLADQPLNKDAMNWSAFSNTCGSSYKYRPFQSTYFNTNVGIICSIISILLSGVIFLLCKHKKYNQLITFVIVFIVFGCMISLSGFLSHYLSGKSMCDGKKLVCSNSSDVNIPQEFCKDIFNCECISSSDCGNGTGCECISSTCNPSNGTRKTTTIKVKKPQKLLIIVSVICLITFPLIFYFLYRDYHLNINKKIVIPVLVVISLLPMIYAIIVSNTKYDKKIYEKSCSYIPPSPFYCTKKTECPDGKICKSGKCENCTMSSECEGKICNFGVCINCNTNIDCEGKICDSTSGKCVPCTDETCLNGMYCKDGFCYAMTAFICKKTNPSDIDIYYTYYDVKQKEKYLSHSYAIDDDEQLKSLFYNGTYWYIIPYNQNKLSYINNKYIECGSIIEIFTLKLQVIRDLAWNIDKKILVVVGGNSNINQIYYYDSSSKWTNIPCNFNNSFANKVACNNDYFLISGDGVGDQKIIKWVNNDQPILEIPVPYLNKINGLVWNKVQKKWVIFGDNIIYSTDDCSNWEKGNQEIFSNVLDVACNDNIWIAVGEKKGVDGDVIAYSSNGHYWYPIEQNLFDRGTKIIWNGNVFISMGFIGSNSIIYYSSEGTKWKNLDMTMFESEIHSIATSFIADQ